MPDAPSPLRDHARAVWQAAVDAVNPFDLVGAALAAPERDLALCWRAPAASSLWAAARPGR